MNLSLFIFLSFLAHCICGSDLLKMNKTQLQYLKYVEEERREGGREGEREVEGME